MFFFNSPPPSYFSTLSLHDALPICALEQLLDGRRLALAADERGELGGRRRARRGFRCFNGLDECRHPAEDRKSTRLNSSHLGISYAVFCLKKKKKKYQSTTQYNKNI